MCSRRAYICSTLHCKKGDERFEVFGVFCGVCKMQCPSKLHCTYTEVYYAFLICGMNTVDIAPCTHCAICIWYFVRCCHVDISRRSCILGSGRLGWFADLASQLTPMCVHPALCTVTPHSDTLRRPNLCSAQFCAPPHPHPGYVHPTCAPCSSTPTPPIQSNPISPSPTAHSHLHILLLPHLQPLSGNLSSRSHQIPHYLCNASCFLNI